MLAHGKCTEKGLITVPIDATFEVRTYGCSTLQKAIIGRICQMQQTDREMPKNKNTQATGLVAGVREVPTMMHITLFKLSWPSHAPLLPLG